MLDADCTAIVVKENTLAPTLEKLAVKPRHGHHRQPGLCPGGSGHPQGHPPDLLLHFDARYKGFLEDAVRGVAAIDRLQDGDRVLIAEGCTHHRQCEDIGTVKIPKWLREHTGKDLELEHSSGRDFPEDLSPYKLVIHCGGCMLNGREMDYRRKTAGDAGVPFTNYGITIAHLKGILKRSVELFPDLHALLP